MNVWQVYLIEKLASGIVSSFTSGIILVHGHVADALQTSDPDVYVTSDGGYNWIKVCPYKLLFIGKRHSRLRGGSGPWLVRH